MYVSHSPCAVCLFICEHVLLAPTLPITAVCRTRQCLLTRTDIGLLYVHVLRCMEILLTGNPTSRLRHKWQVWFRVGELRSRQLHKQLRRTCYVRPEECHGKGEMRNEPLLLLVGLVRL